MLIACQKWTVLNLLIKMLVLKINTIRPCKSDTHAVKSEILVLWIMSSTEKNSSWISLYKYFFLQPFLTIVNYYIKYMRLVDDTSRGIPFFIILTSP